MKRCQDKGLKLNPDKTQLRLDEVSYMGHRITANGLKINTEKAEAIWNMVVPINKQMFAPKLAEITTLRNLIKKENVFKWEEHLH